MARSNKYSSINFNDVYDKKIASSTPSKSHSSRPSPSSSSSYSSASLPHNALPNNTPYKAHLTHGRMLVLTRPTPTPTPAPAPAPKPISVSVPPPQPTPSSLPARNRPEPEDSDPISLRPLGRTGTGLALPSPVPALDRDKEASFSVTSPKSDKFVPPHLRPGFAGKEERPGRDAQKQVPIRGGEPVQRQQGYYGSPGRYGEDARPKSGDYEGMKRGGQADLNRTSSFGSRPSSSGW